MSRIGRKPISLPAGVEIKTENNIITVKGPKGLLSQSIHKDITIEQQDNELLVTRPSDVKRHRAMHGLTRALVANMVTGVTTGFEKRLEMVGVGYRAQMQGNKLVLNIGYSHPIEIDPPQGVEFEVPAVTRVTVKGIDKQLVGNTAADIRALRKPEPYKGKGVRYENEVVKRKAGKSGAK
ncbi:MAG: 50S ribosomal protein L6 [Syntrophomonadaceae bacterium]|nr:50S ribosomal protein L6 [Syntrophomonadaceae bacterium]